MIFDPAAASMWRGHAAEAPLSAAWRLATECSSERDSAQRFHSDLSPRGLEPQWREEERRRKRREGLKGDFPASN